MSHLLFQILLLAHQQQSLRRRGKTQTRLNFVEQVFLLHDRRREVRVAGRNDVDLFVGGDALKTHAHGETSVWPQVVILQVHRCQTGVIPVECVPLAVGVEQPVLGHPVDDVGNRVRIPLEATENLLTKGCSVTAVDSRGFTPALACASNEDTALCLAMIMQVSFGQPGSAESVRKSISSIGKDPSCIPFDLSP